MKDRSFSTLMQKIVDESFKSPLYRLTTKVVKVGNIAIGGENRICVQSMITADTNAIEKAVEEIKRIYETGADIVRLTTPNKKAVESLEKIKSTLISQGYNIPLVADVHFTPNAAILAAEIVEKVRINPGNFVDRKRFSEKTLSDAQYQEELKRIEEKFIPLLEVCKKNATALRIGVNHGSLSDRIVMKYGDNPQGMVASAWEFLKIAQKQQFENLVFSMKSSNPLIMVYAYRLLVKKMQQQNDIYPLHLGVTEAGDQKQGRIKSSVGIGTLLTQGIGDTIRVSLTEPSTNEAPVAKKIIDSAKKMTKKKNDTFFFTHKNIKYSYPTSFSRRISSATHHFGGEKTPQVLLYQKKAHTHDHFSSWGFRPTNTSASPDKMAWKKLDIAFDGILLNVPDKNLSQNYPQTLRIYQKKNTNDFGFKLDFVDNVFYLPNTSPQNNENNQGEQLLFFDVETLEKCLLDEKNCQKLKKLPCSAIVLSTKQHNSEKIQILVEIMRQKEMLFPIIIYPTLPNTDKNESQEDREETRMIDISTTIAPFFINGIADGVLIEETKDLETVFLTLQAVRQRIVKPEYISCPSCGRTLFDLQKVTKKIKDRTSHLKGVKIGIMGCIVNGPGEMADADFGYVGSSPGMITLYKGKEIVQKNVPETEAVDVLIDLIKKYGMWYDNDGQNHE